MSGRGMGNELQTNVCCRLFASRRDALKPLIRHCKNLGCLPPPFPDLFTEILGLIIRRNYFSLQGTQSYHQLSGTAMGASMSVFFANAFMNYCSHGLIHNPPSRLVFLWRYIEDLVGIWRGDPGESRKRSVRSSGLSTPLGAPGSAGRTCLPTGAPTTQSLSRSNDLLRHTCRLRGKSTEEIVYSKYRQSSQTSSFNWPWTPPWLGYFTGMTANVFIQGLILTTLKSCYGKAA